MDLTITAVALVVVAATLGACTDPGTQSAQSTASIAQVDEPTWDPAALATVDKLADRLRAASIACDEYEPFDPAAVANDYKVRLPLPAAMGECTSDGENLTFEVFADSAAAEAFRDAKVKAVCKAVAAKALRFEGFPYVISDGWIIEPDERSTADRIAAALDAESKLGTCD